MPSSSKGEKIMTDLQRLKEKLIHLRLKTMVQNLEATLKEASDKNRDSLFVLHQLADLEAEHRWHNAIKLRFQQSKLNEKLTIDQFDFNHHKSRKDQKTHILNLLNLNFVKELKDVIFIGNPGTGKTFLAKCIAYAACNSNIKILFTTAIDMINQLIAAEADRSLLKKLHYYQSPALLVCDELGYLSLGQQGSHLFFQVISARHQVKSTLLTTNLPFAEWGNVFDSTTVATAIADRLVHNSEVLIFAGESYRRKPKEKRSS
jgi:DNA replication protein DnaC|tara:strand:- start:168 stop:950 length:783 start_codon:yes stop_codon:yes gene_type:complete